MRAATRHRLDFLLRCAALAIAGFSLRPAMGSVGALLPAVRTGVGLNDGLADLLTAMPSACFAAVGTVALGLCRRLGPAAVIRWTMAALGLSLLGRVLLPHPVPFLLFTMIGLLAVGTANIAMPSAVTTYFPNRSGAMMGLYAMSLTAGAALSAAVSVPLSQVSASGWRGGLGVWAVSAVMASALAGMLPRVGGHRTPRRTEPPGGAGALYRNRVAWALAIFFGLQSAGAYIVLGWMSAIFQDENLSPGIAGLLLALTPTVGIPVAFLMPTLANRLRTQASLVVGVAVLGFCGNAGLALAPAQAPWLWATLLGLSQSAFPLALAMIALRGQTSGGVARMSAFAQGVGYLLSVPFPFLFGILHQVSGGWSASLLMTMALLIPQTFAGVYAGRDRDQAVSLPLHHAVSAGADS